MPRIDTIKKVLKLAASANCVSFNHYNLDSIGKGGRLEKQDNFALLVDYHDRRLCVDMKFYRHTTYIEVRELTGYDAEACKWTTEGMRYQIQIDNHRGRKAALTFSEELFERTATWSSCGQKRNYTANRQPGGRRLSVY